MFVAQALTDRRQAYPILDERRRVAMAELVQGALDISLGAVSAQRA